MSVGKLSPALAARQAGWHEWFGYWLHYDLPAVLNLEQHWYWFGTAQDLCLMYGIEYEL